jgi:hypothetical protein
MVNARIPSTDATIVLFFPGERVMKTLGTYTQPASSVDNKSRKGLKK